jgi:hypothetical protein
MASKILTSRREFAPRLMSRGAIVADPGNGGMFPATRGPLVVVDPSMEGTN